MLSTFLHKTKLSKFQVQSLKTSLKAYSRAGSALSTEGATKHMVMAADGVRMGEDVSWVLFNSSTEDISTIDTRRVTVQVLQWYEKKKKGFRLLINKCRLASRGSF